MASTREKSESQTDPFALNLEKLAEMSAFSYLLPALYAEMMQAFGKTSHDIFLEATERTVDQILAAAHTPRPEGVKLDELIEKELSKAATPRVQEFIRLRLQEPSAKSLIEASQTPLTPESLWHHVRSASFETKLKLFLGSFLTFIGASLLFIIYGWSVIPILNLASAISLSLIGSIFLSRQFAKAS